MEVENGAASAVMAERAMPLPPRRARRSKRSGQSWPLILPVVLVAASFGPYLGTSFGLRSEQLAVYLVAPISVIGYLIQGNPPVRAVCIGCIWLAFAAVVLVSTMWPPLEVAPRSADSLLNLLDNLLLPIAVLSTATYIASRGQRLSIRVLEVTSKAVIFCLCLNTLWALLSVFVDTTAVSSRFWSADVAGEIAVAERIHHLGRLGGIFNQPVEAGGAYLIGLVVWLYLRSKALASPLSIGLMVFGGLLSTSKVFLLGTVPIVALHLFRRRKVRRHRRRLWGIALMAGAVALLLPRLPWTGFDLIRGVTRSLGSLTVLSGGRAGGQSGIWASAVDVWRTAPLTGVGFGSLAGPLDNAYTAAFVGGGIVALAIYLTLLVMLGIFASRLQRTAGYEREGILFQGVVAVVIFAGLGAPPLLLNRLSTLLCLFIGLLLAISRSRERVDPRENLIEPSQPAIAFRHQEMASPRPLS